MRRPAVAVALLFIAVAVHATTAGQGWTPDLIMKVKRLGPVVPSPDGARVAFVVSEAVTEGEKSEFNSQIHVANADGTGAFQLTRGDKSSTAPAWSPDGHWIGFLSARSGGKSQVFRIRVGGGEAEQITTDKGAVSAFDWSPDGRSMAFVMADPKTEDEEKADKEKPDPRVVDEDLKLARLYVIPVEKDGDGKRPSKKLTAGEINVNGMDWSPDGASIAIAHSRTPKVFDQNDISIVSVSGGEPRALANTKADENTPIFSRDGRSIAYVTTDDPPTWAFTGAPSRAGSTPTAPTGSTGFYPRRPKGNPAPSRRRWPMSCVSGLSTGRPNRAWTGPTGPTRNWPTTCSEPRASAPPAVPSSGSVPRSASDCTDRPTDTSGATRSSRRRPARRSPTWETRGGR